MQIVAKRSQTLSVVEAARLLKVTQRRMYYMAQKGALPSYKEAGSNRIVFLKSDVRKLVGARVLERTRTTGDE